MLAAMSPYTASPLQLHEVGRAYPLVQLLMPSIDRRRWERFARSFLRQSRRRGIIAVRDHRGHVRGLAIYRREIDVGGPVLNADPVLFVDLLDASELALALIRALEATAWEADCAALHVNLGEAVERGWRLPEGVAQLETRRRLITSVRRGAEASYA